MPHCSGYARCDRRPLPDGLLAACPVTEEVELRPSVQQLQASVVFLGKFNPAIFSPGWLAKNGLISDAEMEAAVVNVIHQDVTQFVAGAFKFDINQQRFHVASADEPFVSLLDLTAGIFGDRLVHTPLEKLGINLEALYLCRSAKQRLAFGRALAPIAPWGDFGRRVDSTPLPRSGGITSMTMQENPEGRRGYRRVEIEPFSDTTRVKISVNDHFEAADPDKVDGAIEMVTRLSDEFDRSIAESKKIIGDLIDVSAGFPE